MKLSIIVPVYNTEKHLEKCINSILQQSYKNIEIIIINDGSKDKSKEIIKKLKEKNPKIIKTINQNNKGQAYSRNKGLSIANGEIITFVDSDDYIEPDMYQKMIALMEKEKSDMVICDFYIEQNGEKVVNSSTNFNNLINCSVSVCNKIFRKTIIDKMRFIEGIWYEDYNFFTKLALTNPVYSLCKEPLYNYVIHGNSTMNNNNSTKNLDIIKATEDIFKKQIDKDIMDNLIINHILLDAINRVHAQKNINKKYVIKELNKYIHKHIKKIFNTKTYKESSFKKKIIIVLNYYNLGIISKLLLNIRKVI